MYAIYIKFSGISNEESVKCGERGEIPDKMIVDPRLREDDKRDRGDDKEGCEDDKFV